MEKRAQHDIMHQTDDIASDIHAIKLKKFLYPKKKLNIANRRVLLQLLQKLEVDHPLSRVIEFPQFHEARKRLARLAQKQRHITYLDHREPCMSRIYESRDLTKGQADESAQAARDDLPPALNVQEIAQPDGRYTVIATYADADAATQAAGQPPADKAPTAVVTNPAMITPPAATSGPSIDPFTKAAGVPTPPLPADASPLTLEMLEKHWPSADASLRATLGVADDNARWTSNHSCCRRIVVA